MLGLLRQTARSHPRAARRALAEARSLRETLFATLSAIARGVPAPPDTLRRLERRWKRSVSLATLARTPGGIMPVLQPGRVGLETISCQIALWAVFLLRTLPDPRLRLCEGNDCAWLFLDTSKSGRRRWCDMATCGNASKARRHYARLRKGEKR